MKLNQRALRTILSLCLFIGVAAAASAQSVVLQMGASVPVNSPWDLGMKKLAAEWSRVSNGRVKLVFQKSVANASQDEIIQKLNFALDGALLETSGLFYLEKDLFMLAMPSVIRNDAEFAAAIKSIKPLMEQKIGNKYEIINIGQGGWIYLFSNKALVKPEDLVDMRIGVNRDQDILIKQLQSIGTRTVKSDSASFLLQFNSNAIDVAYTSPLLVATLWSQLKRSVTHISAFRLSPFFGAIVFNKRAWDRIPADLKPALQAAADKITLEIAADSLKLETDAIATMKKQGLLVPSLTEADFKAWNELFTGPKMKTLMGEWFTPDFVRTVYQAVESERK